MQLQGRTSHYPLSLTSFNSIFFKVSFTFLTSVNNWNRKFQLFQGMVILLFVHPESKLIILMSVTSVFCNHSNIFQNYIFTSFIENYKSLLIFTFAIIWYTTIWFALYSSLYFSKFEFCYHCFFLNWLSCIKHTLVSPYCMYLLLIPINFWFAPVIAFHHHPIFVLCSLFSSPPYRFQVKRFPR